MAAMLVLSACGSTKVYTADKTITYNGSLYNMSNVQKISSSISGRLGNGNDVNMRTMDKKAIEALIRDEGSVMVTMAVQMDSEEMVYRRSSVDRYSDYSSMEKKFDSAMKSINKFMADKKKTQLKLK
jgi:hypothetical protein